MNSTRKIPGLLSRYLPILTWGAEYSRRTFTYDLIVAGHHHGHAHSAVAHLSIFGGIRMKINGQLRRSGRRVDGGIRS